MYSRSLSVLGRVPTVQLYNSCTTVEQTYGHVSMVPIAGSTPGRLYFNTVVTYLGASLDVKIVQGGQCS